MRTDEHDEDSDVGDDAVLGYLRQKKIRKQYGSSAQKDAVAC